MLKAVRIDMRRLAATTAAIIAIAAQPPVAEAASGPRAIAHYGGGKIAPSSLQWRAPTGEAHGTGTRAWEPTLGVSRNGRIFFIGARPVDARTPIGTRGEFPVLLSKDGGRSWRDVSPGFGPERQALAGYDPFLYVDEQTGRVFASSFKGCTAVSFTDDEGKTWTSSAACGLTDHQNIFAGPAVVSPTLGYPHVVYHCAIDGGALAGFSTMTSCLKSLDGGIAWIRTGAPAYTDDPRQEGGDRSLLPAGGHCEGATGHGVVDRKGTVYLPRGWCGQPYLAISRDEGATWERVRVARNGMPVDSTSLEEHEASVAVDRSGNVYYFWMARNRLPYLAISKDGGKRWSKPMMIGAPGVTEAWGPTIAVGDVGKVAVAYLGTKDLYDWNGYITMTTNALAGKPLFYSGTVDRDALVRGECPVLRCGVQGDFIDIAITPRGIPIASFVDGCIGRPESSCGEDAGLGASFGRGLVGALVGGPRLR